MNRFLFFQPTVVFLKVKLEDEAAGAFLEFADVGGVVALDAYDGDRITVRQLYT